MHFKHAIIWDKGEYYDINQDSFSLQILLTGSGPYAMAMVCDGIGGLLRGEEASGYTLRYMTTWFYENAIPLLCKRGAFRQLKRSCQRALGDVHDNLQKNGSERGDMLGTTFTMLILGKEKFYTFHVGDCSCFILGKRNRKLTTDQLNERGELIQAVGVGKVPEIMAGHGRYGRRNAFLLCSDGFAGCLNRQRLKGLWECSRKGDNNKTQKMMQEILARGRQKGERDNCTAIYIQRV